MGQMDDTKYRISLNSFRFQICFRMTAQSEIISVRHFVQFVFAHPHARDTHLVDLNGIWW